VQQAEEEWKQVEEDNWRLKEEEKKKKLEEVEKAYKVQLQEEKRWRDKGKRKASEVAEDNKDIEKEPSGSNKKVSH
jgi:hypothetical protein